MEDKKNVRLPWPGWTVVKYLGEGGYGRVYEIERDLSGVKEQAALKVVSRPVDDAEIEACYENGYDQASMKASYQEELQRYVKEYQLMKELQGQTNIVSCDDFAVVPRKDGIGGQIFIRMELLTPLQKATKQSMLSESEVIKLGKDICKALMLCEARHIIHRDIKPENILVSKFGDYKLGDFGVARVQDHTTNATKMGTHGYAAPEVEHGQKYGKEADIYSLGITLYWLLNNRRMPFLNADEPITAMKNQEALRRRYEGEKLPAPKNGSTKLKQVVLKACAYRPEDRYRSAQDLYDALSELSGVHTASYRKSTASDKAGHITSSAGAASGGSDFDDLFAAMNQARTSAASTGQAVQKKGSASSHSKSTGQSTAGDSFSGTAGGAFSDGGTVSSGSKGTMSSTSATNASWGAGYSGKTEGNGWDDATNETIGQPKPKKKTSGASAGSAGKGQTSEPIEKTMGKAEAYKKQEKPLSERVAAMESVQASKKKEMPWWLDLIIAAALLVALYNRDAIFDWVDQKIIDPATGAISGAAQKISDKPAYTYAYSGGGGYVDETDANGNTTFRTYYRTDDTIYYECEYDGSGNKTKEVWYRADGTKEYILEFDSQGNNVKSTYYDEEGNQTSTVTTEYGEDGHRSAQTTYDSEERKKSYTTYEWTGDELTKQVDTSYRQDGTVFGYRVLECDDNGNHVSDTQYDSDWNVTTYTADYQYDSDGNLLQCTEYNGDGSVSKKMVYYQQNEGDLLWKVRWYDADGNLTYDSGAKD